MTATAPHPLLQPARDPSGGDAAAAWAAIVREKPQYPRVSISANVRIPMSDGTALRAYVIRPADASGRAVEGSFPTVLNLTPYNKLLMKGIDTVLEAPDGRAALAELLHRPDTALLVTDLEMPGMGGLELLRALAARPELPKLVVSSCTAPPPLDGLGVAGFFCKPPDLARLKATVAQLVGSPVAS